MSKSAYLGVNGIARKISNIYVGVNTDIPIYETTTTSKTYALNIANLDKFFGVETSADYNGWTYTDYSSGGLKLVPGNFGVDSSTATITLTALRSLTKVEISGAYYTESNYDKITLTVNNSTILNAVSGTSAYASRWTGSLSSGQQIILKYVKDGSRSETDEDSTYFTIVCADITTTNQEQTLTGYKKMDVARKVKKGYIGVNGIARLFYNGYPFGSYSGEYTVSTITNDGIKYHLYTLTTSGTLILNNSVNCWLCGGGAGGGKSYYKYHSNSNGYKGYTGYGGGGGGGGYVNSGTLSDGEHPVVIGAGGAAYTDGGTTSVGSLTAAGGSTGVSGKGGSGGSGGGGGAQNGLTSYGPSIAGGSGAGVSTYPFGLTSLKAHCAGGAGGQHNCSSTEISTGDEGSRFNYGGNGGTNGGDGYASSSTPNSTETGTTAVNTGGVYGGGNDAEAATFYGGGGGGESLSNYSADAAGSGYQGVVYLLIPV